MTRIQTQNENFSRYKSISLKRRIFNLKHWPFWRVITFEDLLIGQFFQLQFLTKPDKSAYSYWFCQESERWWLWASCVHYVRGIFRLFAEAILFQSRRATKRSEFNSIVKLGDPRYSHLAQADISVYLFRRIILNLTTKVKIVFSAVSRTRLPAKINQRTNQTIDRAKV